MDEKMEEIEKKVKLKYFCNPMNFKTVENDFGTLLSHIKESEEELKHSRISDEDLEKLLLDD